MVDLDKNTRQSIRKILAEYCPDQKVLLVGSRASGPAKKYADVDLLILDKTPVAAKQFSLIKLAFEESDIPYKVDLLSWSELTPSFRQRLLRNHAEI